MIWKICWSHSHTRKTKTMTRLPRRACSSVNKYLRLIIVDAIANCNVRSEFYVNVYREMQWKRNPSRSWKERKRKTEDVTWKCVDTRIEIEMQAQKQQWWEQDRKCTKHTNNSHPMRKTTKKVNDTNIGLVLQSKSRKRAAYLSLPNENTRKYYNNNTRIACTAQHTTKMANIAAHKLFMNETYLTLIVSCIT